MKRLLYVVPLSLIVILGLFAALIYTRADSITPERYAKINLGMSENEVSDVLSRPADKQYQVQEIAPFLQPNDGTDPEWEKLWFGSKWVVAIQFDAKGLVCTKGIIEASRFAP